MKRTWILSYPSSGNHLTRAFVEFLTQQPTYGCIRNPNDIPLHKYDPDGRCLEVLPTRQSEKRKLFFKAHQHTDVENNKTANDSLILIIRSPYESVSYGNLEKKENMKIFENNLLYFQKWKGSKLVLYYEDYFVSKDKNIRKLGQFLGISEKRIKRCIEKQEIIRRYSKKILKNRIQLSNIDDIFGHQKIHKISLPNINPRIYPLLQRYFENKI
jgi:hypothetical protein